jgi:flagellar basal body-associated protein FliL
MRDKIVVIIIVIVVAFDLAMCGVSIWQGVDDVNYSNFTPDFQQR